MSTKLQLADSASRKINFKEEFLPKSMFERLMGFLQIYPTVDGFATATNKKLPKYITLDETDREAWAEDFFFTSDSNLRNELLYLFPPKQCLTRVLGWAAKTSVQFVLLFHVFDAWPLGFGKLRMRKNIKIWQLPVDTALTIIPAEKKLEIWGETFQGFVNKRAKQTVLLTANVYGPFRSDY